MVFIGRMFDWLKTHLDSIDEEYIDKNERSTGRLLGVVYFSAMMLLLLNYIVINYQNQLDLANWIVGLVGKVAGPEAEATWASPACRRGYLLQSTSGPPGGGCRRSGGSIPPRRSGGGIPDLLLAGRPARRPADTAAAGRDRRGDRGLGSSQGMGPAPAGALVSRPRNRLPNRGR